MGHKWSFSRKKRDKNYGGVNEGDFNWVYALLSVSYLSNVEASKQHMKWIKIMNICNDSDKILDKLI